MVVSVGSSSTVAEWLPYLGTLLTIIGLFYTGWQLSLSRKLAKNQFVLDLYDKMDVHNNVHEILTDDSIQPANWPLTRKDWIAVGRLLGLFEHIGGLVKDGMLSIDQVDESFSYRLAPLLGSPNIRDFIYNNADTWDQLIWLINQLENKAVYSKIANHGIVKGEK